MGVALQGQWVGTVPIPPPGDWGPWCQQAATHRVGNAPCSAPCRNGGQLTLPNAPGGVAARTPGTCCHHPVPGPTRDSPPSQLLPMGVRASISTPHLHDKLPRVGPGHRGALSRCQDANGPDVQCCCPEIAAQDDALCRDTPMGTPKHPPPQASPSGVAAAPRPRGQWKGALCPQTGTDARWAQLRATHPLVDVHRDRLVVGGEDASVVADAAVDTLVVLQGTAGMSDSHLAAPTDRGVTPPPQGMRATTLQGMLALDISTAGHSHHLPTGAG